MTATHVPPRQIRDRAAPLKDAEAYRYFAETHRFCQCCGAWPAATDFRELSTHHVIKQGRSDDACNCLRLCGVCHDLAEGLTVKDRTGQPLPRLTIGVCLGLKLTREPLEYDHRRLTVLRGSRLPDLEPVPQRFEAMFRQRHPRDLAAWDIACDTRIGDGDGRIACIEADCGHAGEPSEFFGERDQWGRPAFRCQICYEKSYAVRQDLALWAYLPGQLLAWKRSVAERMKGGVR